MVLTGTALDRAAAETLDVPAGSPEALLEAYQPLVGAIAKQLHGSLPSSVELDDLIQLGQVGLLHAISRYSEHRNVRFSTYAKFRIRGAMLDGLRELDWAPRHVRAEARRRSVAQSRFEVANGRTATESELAEILGQTLEQFREHQMEAPPELLSFSGGGARENETDWDPVCGRPTPLDAALAGEMSDRVAAALQQLPERERFVVRSYYWDSRTMADIANQIGVNESRVSQLRKRAMERLKECLRDGGGWPAAEDVNRNRPQAWGKRT